MRSMQYFTYKYWSTTQTKGGQFWETSEKNTKKRPNPKPIFFKESRRPPLQLWGISFFFLLGHGTNLPSLRPVLPPFPAAHKTPLLSFPHLLVICLLQPAVSPTAAATTRRRDHQRRRPLTALPKPTQPSFSLLTAINVQSTSNIPISFSRSPAPPDRGRPLLFLGQPFPSSD